MGFCAPLSPEMVYYLGDYQRERDRRPYEVPDWCVPAFRTPEPTNFPDAVFDPRRVDRVIEGLARLRHTKGKWAGRPLVPDPWQVAWFIGPVFGWVAPIEGSDAYGRIISNALLDVSRKAGKTTLASGLGIYLAFGDDEQGAEVLTVAGSKDQAGNAYKPAKLIASKSPSLRRAGVRPLITSLVRESDGSFFKAVASVGDLIHGANVHGAIVDELHIHKSAEVLDAVESGTGARDQPLVIIITTTDDGKPTSVYSQKRDYIEKLASGVLTNDRQYGVIFGAEEDDDPFIEATWRKANPGFGVSPTRAFLEGESRRAQQSPVNLARFQRLHLGIRAKAGGRYLTMPEWDRNAGMVDAGKFGKTSGRVAYGGLDLGNTADLTSLCWVFPDENGGYDVLWRFWLPAERMAELDRRTARAASVWHRNGLLVTTPGNVTDYDVVRAAVKADLDRFQVKELCFDPWNATQLTNDLTSAGAPMVQVRQGYISLSPPLKEIKRLLMQGHEKDPKLRHGGNAIMRWMIYNLAVASDPSGNVKPDKASASDKIDGVSALVTAMNRAMHHQGSGRSVYEDDDLEIV